MYMQAAKTKTPDVVKMQGDNALAGPVKMQKRIGSTTYEVQI
jgi:hypothetical protein